MIFNIEFTTKKDVDVKQAIDAIKDCLTNIDETGLYNIDIADSISNLETYND